MSTKDKERVKELHNMMQGNKVYTFSCSACKLMARPADCIGCPVYSQSFSAD